MSQTHLARQGGPLQDTEKLRDARVSLGMTRPEAAALIGCHPKSLEYMENGRRGASDVMLSRIARAYGLSVEDISKTNGCAA